ncbi:MAG TPA: RluA family pseudouridine synthase [Salinimicrobium sp.]|nr:RluA family pseudouridine synthase [Salinimicrobium sp.]
MEKTEAHIVPRLPGEIRIQEYAVGIFYLIKSRSAVKKAIKRGEILLEGKPAETSDWVKEGQKIEFRPTVRKEKIFRLNLNILFEDQFISVIEKPAGLPTSGNYFRTLQRALPFNLEPSSALDALPRPLPVHRLDNPTSGLLIIAKTADALVRLNRDFEEKKISKLYSAIVLGNPPEEKTITLDIEGKPAVTRLKKTGHFIVEETDLSLLQIFPETGRTHQIRIHLSRSGFPILGDTQYNGTTEKIKSSGLHLSATGLQFEHPQTKKQMNFEIPPGGNFQNTLNMLKSS